MKYVDYLKVKREGFNALPVFWAFSMEQFREAMEERGLTENDTDKIFSLGAGGYFLKKDKDIIHAYFSKKDELPELMKDPVFAEDAFYYEMCNHEYGINGQGDWDVCSCFGKCEYEYDKGGKDYLEEIGYGPDVVKAYKAAERRYYKDAEENEWF